METSDTRTEQDSAGGPVPTWSTCWCSERSHEEGGNIPYRIFPGKRCHLFMASPNRDLGKAGGNWAAHGGTTRDSSSSHLQELLWHTLPDPEVLSHLMHVTK